MVRTKHLVLVILGAVLIVLLGLTVFRGGETQSARVLHAAFAVPREAYEVFQEVRDSRGERREAFIASVRAALRENPAREPDVEPSPAPAPSEAVRVAIPPGRGVLNSGDAAAVIAPAEETRAIERSPDSELSPVSSSTGTSTQP